MGAMFVLGKPAPPNPNPPKAVADPKADASKASDPGLTIDAPFYQAGLAGYSDAAMRLVAREHGCPYCITEAMLDQFLVAGGKGLKEAELDDADHPIAGQLMGSHPDEIAAGAKVLVKLGYDVIDVNLACPVKKIKKKARGGHLLSAPDEATAILEAVKQAVGDDRPVTTKLRRAYADTAEAQDAFTRVFERALDLGYAGATVHGRTVEQKYIGPSNWDALRDLVQRYPKADRPHFTLGGSGDIWQAPDIFRMLEHTGVDWVSVARGCIGNPWVFTQARAIMAGQTPEPPTIHQQADVLRRHFTISVRLHGEHRAGRMMRKFGIKFARHHPDHDAIKAGFIAVRSLAEWDRVLATHYADDGPGVPLDKVEQENAGTNNAPRCDPVGV